MSCESGGVKVDHAYSVPNSGPESRASVSKIGLFGSEPRMWISSGEMSEQRRAWLAFSVENHGNV
jgi:hypothetical protein